MEKCNEKKQEIRYYSNKNSKLLTVKSNVVRAYTKHLEDRETVKEFEVHKKLIPERVQQLQRVDIRKDYIDSEWETDVYITYSDGSNGVREIVKEEWLERRAVVEKLELSRRYWKSIGITNWKIVIMEG